MVRFNYLDISSPYHDTIHLFKGELSCLGDVIFYEGKALVFVCDRVPGKIHTFDGTKWQEGLFNCVFFDLKVDTANVDPEIQLNTK